MATSVVLINPSSWIEQRAPERMGTVEADQGVRPHSVFFDINTCVCKFLLVAKVKEYKSPNSIFQS